MSCRFDSRARAAIRVYIAGPYSGGDVGKNIREAMIAWHRLRNLGFIPFCPHLSHFLHLLIPLEYEDWLLWDLEWLRVCDAVLRLPGESPGADREVLAANDLNIPVFTTIEALIEFAK